jgi:hypothetical protein
MIGSFAEQSTAHTLRRDEGYRERFEGYGVVAGECSQRTERLYENISGFNGRSLLSYELFLQGHVIV